MNQKFYDILVKIYYNFIYLDFLNLIIKINNLIFINLFKKFHSLIVKIYNKKYNKRNNKSKNVFK